MENTQTLQLLNKQNGKNRLVFIDPTVDDYQSLEHGVLPDTEIVILDADRDGVEQISELLAQRSGITSLHIVSHGAPGRVYLGNTELGQHTLNRYAGQLINWARAFNDDAQLLLYGCDVAKTELGKVFVQHLSKLTGTVVLASDNRTGSIALGGDWELEVTTKSSTVALAFESATLEAYSAVLAKPYLVKDINPNFDSSTPYSLTNVDGTLYLVADDGVNGYELWKSDGTEAGTILVKNFIPAGSGSPSNLTNVDGTLYFAADDVIHGQELWKSDGTEIGTVLVKDIRPGGRLTLYPAVYSPSANFFAGSSPSQLTNINGTLYFTIHKSGVWQNVLLKSDGTSEGTIELKEFLFQSDSVEERYSFSPFINVDSTLYFGLNVYDGPNIIRRELWKSDSTPEGTVLVKNINLPSRYEDFGIGELKNINGTIYFFTINSNTDNSRLQDYKLWKSDGTEAGTILVKEFKNISYEPRLPNLTNVNNILYFFFDDGIYGRELWKSDGTEAGTILVKDINPGSAGSGNEYFVPNVNINGTLYFIADDGIHGQELWKSDGTEAGTVLVKDINPGSSSATPSYSNFELTNVNGTLYFIADDGIHGQELWKSDGTEAGTVLVGDINPGSGSSFTNNFALSNVDGILYFTANDGTHGSELWALNVTPPTINPIVSIIAIDANAAEAGNDPAIFRISRTGDINTELTLKYNIDGTATNGKDYNQLNGIATIAAGQSFVDVTITALNDTLKEGSETVSLTLFTQSQYALDTSNRTATVISADDTSTAERIQPYLVQNIYINDNLDLGSNGPISDLKNVNGILYFIANDITKGRELWKSNGTPETTRLVKDINPGFDSSNPNYLGDINGILYFTADDGIHGRELWKSDGTAAGTVLVKDINPGSGSSAITDEFGYIRYPTLTNVNGTFYFIADDRIHGQELWKSDGTAAGTVLVKDINPGSNSSSSYPSGLTNVNDILYFIADDGIHGQELWKSDGTVGGTALVKDINRGSRGSSLYGLTNVNDIVYFIADDGIHGQELWKSDGTAAGTVLVKDIKPGSGGSNFSRLTNVNDTLYFQNYNYNKQTNELWKSDGTAAGTVLVREINQESNDAYIFYVTNYNSSYLSDLNGSRYFFFDDGIRGRELWKSDGTVEGTLLVKDINPGSGGSDGGISNISYYNDQYSTITNLNGILYFIASDGTGTELWQSDGTEAGTVQVTDINIGIDQDSIYYYLFSRLTNVNNTLYFTNGGLNGGELWAFNPNPTTITPTVSISTTDAKAAESGTNPAIFRISRTGDTSIALAVNYTIDGTATNGSDYTQLTGIASFAVGQSFVDIAITPVDDDLVEGSETVTLTLATGIDYEIDTSYTFATVAIADSINIINGGNSRDPLTGTEGSDRIVGGTGSKTITGAAGNDEFVYTNIREVGHRITDFTVGSDKIVLTELLDSLANGSYNGSNAIADGYVRLVQGSTNNSTILQIDRDGLMGSAVFRPFIQLDNITPQAMNNISNFVF